MQLQTIIDAWNEQADASNQWADLDPDEQVEFALKHVEAKARDALDDLRTAAYEPEISSISVDHAIRHVMQVFYE